MNQPPLDKGKGVLHYELDGVTEEQVHRFRENMDVIIAQGVLGMHDGKAVLSFDYEGRLREISFDFKKWRKQKESA